MSRQLFQSSSMAEALSSAFQGLAPIIADAVYPIEVFKRCTGLEKASIRKMRHQGFVVRQIGRRNFVLGSDFVTWCGNAPQVAT
jgi:hypothetical protein